MAGPVRQGRVKAAGFNAVETYVAWNRSERRMPDGVDDYSKLELGELAERSRAAAALRWSGRRAVTGALAAVATAGRERLAPGGSCCRQPVAHPRRHSERGDNHRHAAPAGVLSLRRAAVSPSRHRDRHDKAAARKSRWFRGVGHYERH